jgi:serine protease Do
MKHLLAPGLALALLTTASVLPAMAEQDRAALMRVVGSVWKVEVQRAQGGYSLGSGVAVADDQILTNCHVTRDARAASVVRGGVRWRVDAQAADIDHDLCLLRVPGLQASPVSLGRSVDLRAGQPVQAFGYTGGMELQHSNGQVVRLHRLDHGRVIQSSNAFTSGASGGGLFDEQMRLVGILTFRLRGGAAHYYAAPVEWLLTLQRDEGQFVAVQPLAADRVPFWLRRNGEQPNFLRAAVLEAERRWDELEGLAFNWARADADDPQPWYLQGVALDGLQRWPESQRALERSVQLEPTSQLAWFRLGLVHTEQGQLERARQARGQLESLRSDLAPVLGRAIDKL